MMAVSRPTHASGRRRHVDKKAKTPKKPKTAKPKGTKTA